MKTPHILVLAAVGAIAPAMAHAHPRKPAAATHAHATASHPAKAAASPHHVRDGHVLARVTAPPRAATHQAHAEPVRPTRAERARQAREDASEARARARMTPAQRRRADHEEALAKARERSGRRQDAPAERHPLLAAGRGRASQAAGDRVVVRTAANRTSLREPGALLSDGSRELPAQEASMTALPAGPPNPELTRVRHDRKQHFSPAVPAPPSSEPAPQPQPQATLSLMGAPLAGATFSSDEPRTGVSVVEDVDSVDTPSHDAAARAAAPAPARRTPAPIVRQQPADATQMKSALSLPVRPSRLDAPAVGAMSVAAVEMKPVPASAAPALAAVSPIMLYNKHGQLIVPAALKGSHEILVHQNVMADVDGLDRVQDDADLEAMRTGKLLVPVPEGPGLRSDDRLPENRRYCRPWTAMFLKALSQAHYQRFGTPLQVNSAVRTVEFQQRLQRTNGNAAPAEGETASPHLTGQAVDLAKHGLSMTEIAWMRGYLLPLVQEGKIDVEEEFQQACFHISVYRKYVPAAPPKRVIAARGLSGSALAAATIR